jgi:N-acetylglucosaminyldiphosphoundecaprenol N-acetyl-beta-D-mannosaminyltransferase
MTLDDAVGQLRAFAQTGEGRAVHLCNAWTLALARRDHTLAEVLNRGDLNLTDGMPLTWAARRVGFAQRCGHVRGTDLLLATARAGRADGLRHYLYGSTQATAAALAGRLATLAPGIEIVGVESPPFRPLTEGEEAELVERVCRARPDIIWVGLGTPQQDLFLDRFRECFGAVLVAVGAAFDFVAGAKRQAPDWMQNRGLEWIFRLIMEPRRLWRRYLIGNALFLAGLARGIETPAAHKERR